MKMHFFFKICYFETFTTFALWTFSGGYLVFHLSSIWWQLCSCPAMTFVIHINTTPLLQFKALQSIMKWTMTFAAHFVSVHAVQRQWTFITYQILLCVLDQYYKTLFFSINSFFQ